MDNQAAKDLQPGQLILVDGGDIVIHPVPTGVEVVATASNHSSDQQNVVSDESASGSNEEVN